MKISRIIVLFFLASPLIFLTGCPQKPPTAEQADTVALSADLPMPDDKTLAALGAENKLPAVGLLPDAILITVAKPKALLTSPFSKGLEPLLESVAAQYLRMPYRATKIEQVFQATGMPVQVPITFSDPKNPNAAPQTQIVAIARRSVVITFDAPVTREMVLAPFVGELANNKAALDEMKKTEGTTEYYNITPQNAQTPQHFAIGLPDNKTVVVVEGQSDDIKSVFSVPTKKNAIIERLKHTPFDNNELTILTSLEGIHVDLPWLEQNIKTLNFLPENVVAVLVKQLRAITFTVAFTAKDGEPLVSVRAEARNEAGAKEISDTLQGWQLNAQTSLVALDEADKKQLAVAPELATQLLNAIQIKTDASLVSATLNNFDKLLPTLAQTLLQRQAFAQQMQIQQQRTQQLVLLSQYCAAYVQQNKKFPADIVSQDGKPLLSWRVAMLPTLGLEELYKKFKLDEAWNSPANAPLISEMPSIFVPLVPNVQPPKTVIRFFNSSGTLLANPDLKPEDLKYPNTTLLYVSVAPQYAVEWTKPDKLAFDAEKIAEITGNPLFGVTFAHQPLVAQLVDKTHADYATQLKNLDAMVNGLEWSKPAEPVQQNSVQQSNE